MELNEIFFFFKLTFWNYIYVSLNSVQEVNNFLLIVNYKIFNTNYIRLFYSKPQVMLASVEDVCKVIKK